MTTRFPTRLAAGAAAGAIALTLAAGGAAYADGIAAPADEIAAPVAASTDAAASTPPTEAAPPSTTEAAPAAPADPAPPSTTEAAPPAPADPAPAESEPAGTEPATSAPAPGIAEPAEQAAAPAAAAAADGSAPTVTIDMPAAPASGWFTRNVNVLLSAADADGDLASTSFQIDDGTVWTATAATRALQVGGDGRHTLRTWATDAAGNVSAIQTREVDIDSTGPRVDSFSIPQDRILRQGARVDFTFGCDDDVSGLESCTTDGRLPDGSLDTSIVGEHSFDIVAVDKAGNRSVTEYRYRVVDDTTSPTVAATVTGHSEDGWFTGDDTALTIRLEDDIPEQTLIEYRINGEYFNAAGPEVVVPLTEDGVLEIQYGGRDAADNVREPQFLTVRRDTVAPSLALEATDATGGAVLDGAVITRGDDIRLTYGCTDATSGVEECAGPMASGALLDTDAVGAHSVVLTATDVAGHETSARFGYTVAAAAGDPSAPTDPSAPVDPATPAAPATAPAPGPTPAIAEAPDSLATTGAGDKTPLALAAAGLVAAGAVLTAIGLRRRNAR